MVFYSLDDTDAPPRDIGCLDSWRDFAGLRFRSVFRELGWSPTCLAHPEIYPDATLLPEQNACVNGRSPAPTKPPVHISLRSLGRMNLVKGARNICIWPWREPSLPDAFPPSGDIRENARHMLSLVDQIWCSSDYAANVLQSHGLYHAVSAPAPIPMAAPTAEIGTRVKGRLAAFRRDPPLPGKRQRLADFLRTSNSTGKARLFVTVADPDDQHAHLESLLRGFALAARGSAERGERRNVLVVVLALDATRRSIHRQSNWLDVMARRSFCHSADLISDDIMLVDQHVSAADLIGLFDQSDFFLSAASACDQNIPMQMAMARGVIPVAPWLGEAGAYLTDTLSIEIPFDGFPSNSLETSSPHLNTSSRQCDTPSAPTARAVAEACRLAFALSPNRQSALSQRAAEISSEQFSMRAATDRALRLIAFGGDVEFARPNAAESRNNTEEPTPLDRVIDYQSARAQLT